MQPGRKAFTLIEIVVAITVGAMILLGASGVMNQLADAARRLHLYAAATDRAANRERDLRELLANVEVGTPGSQPFVGNADSATFSSWCHTPGGWLERCSVILSIECMETTPGSASQSLVVHVGARRDVVMTRYARSARLRYLNGAADGGQWYVQWTAGIRAPLAIGVIMDRDTTFVRVGGIP